MYTLLYTCCLGLLCLALEIMNMRRFLVPMILAGLAGIFFVNWMDWQQMGPFSMWGIDMSHMMKVDAVSIAFNSLFIGGGAFAFAYTADFYKDEQHHISDYLAILVFIVCGAMVLAGMTSMVMLFLGIEIISISLYIMAGRRKYETRSNEAGFKYFLMGSFASAILLFGITLIYGATGSFAFEQIQAFSQSAGPNTPMFLVGCILIIVALLFKVAAVPFHFWSPDVYEGSPTLVTAWMSTMVKVAFFVAFYRVRADALIGEQNFTAQILMLIAADKLVFGNLVALHQDNFKRLLAYSGISHAGYMLMGILSIKSGSLSALFFYGTGYILATLGAFGVAIPVFRATGKETIDAFNGLGKKKPFLAILLTMSMLSLAGIPPLAGFLGKYYIFSEAIQSGYVALTVLAVITSVIGVYYYFKVILAMYTMPADEQAIKPSMLYTLVIVACAGLSLFLGIWPAGWIGLL